MSNINETITYSASCVPPNDVLSPSSSVSARQLQKIDVKFPTFLGKSMGFVTIKNTWNNTSTNNEGDKRFMKPFSLNATQQRISRKSSFGSSRYRPVRRDQSEYACNYPSNPEEVAGSFCLVNKNSNVLPNNYQPRNRVSRFYSLPRPKEVDLNFSNNNGMYPDDNENTEVSQDNTELSNTCIVDSNCSNCWMFQRDSADLNSRSQRPNKSNRHIIEDDDDVDDMKQRGYSPLLAPPRKSTDDWIELFIQFPDRCLQRIHTRYNAPFKHAIRAITARLGYRSVSDLDFYLKESMEPVFINDSPSSLGLKSKDVIIVKNV